MDEDNDDQWLYGEDPTSEKSAAADKVDDPSETIPNPSDSAEENITLPEPSLYKPNLEPPIIKPPEASNFDVADVVPGEEEILVPLDPPVINAPQVTEETPKENEEEGEPLANGEATGEAVNEEKGKTSKSGAKLSEGEEEDDEDDNIDVVIGDIRTTPNYNANLHIKRANLLTLTKVYHYRPSYYQQQPHQQAGKFAADDFESIGLINGVPGHEFNLDTLEDKPWRKPGADITDYFNYGFNEDTWRAYCERQKRMRVHESGSGLIPMNQTANNVHIIPNVNVPPPNMMGPMGMSDVNSGSINVIGGANTRRSGDSFAKENTIQVMTADRREYSKKNFTPDMSIPPPGVPPPFGALPPGIPPPFPMNQYGPPPADYFPPEMDPYYHSFDHSQDANWPGQNWNANIDVKNMIPLSVSGGQRSVNGASDNKPSAEGSSGGVKVKTEPEDRDGTHDRDRDRERDRSRDYDRDRDRESRHRDRSHRHRTRSRSHERRSRKHKSRSRSPGYRSHKKKKSKKSERSKSDSD